jgi:hypothetical protein
MRISIFLFVRDARVDMALPYGFSEYPVFRPAIREKVYTDSPFREMPLHSMMSEAGVGRVSANRRVTFRSYSDEHRQLKR